MPRPRLCASAQNERAVSKSSSKLRTSCPWPRPSSRNATSARRSDRAGVFASREQQPSLFAGRARMKDAHSSASDRRSSSSAARTAVHQVHRTFRCLDRLKFSHAQRDSPLTMTRVYVYHYTLPVAIGHSSNSRPGLKARPPFCAATKYPPTGSTLGELASVSGVGGCALKPLGTKRLPGAEGPSETKRKRKAEVLFSSSRFFGQRSFK